MADQSLAVKIQALVSGLQNVDALTHEVEALARAAGIPLADPTAPLNHGADTTKGKVAGLAAELSKLAGSAALLEFLRSAVEALRESERSFAGLESASARAGISIRESFGAASQLAADGLITVGDASTALQNLLSRGYSLDAALGTLNRLKDAAAFNRQAHLSMGEAVVQASEGLKNENSILVDNAGVTKNVAKMWEDYAKKLGVTTESLTQAQKIQAEVSGVMEETAGQVGNAAKAAAGLEGGFAKATSATKELLTAFGGDLEPIVQLLASLFMGLIEAGKTTGFMFNALGISAGTLAISIGDILDAVTSLNFDGLNEKLSRHLRQMDDELQAVAQRYAEGITPQIQRTIEKTDEATRAQERHNKAQADARAADKEREEGLKQLNVQAELGIKLAEAQAKTIAEAGKAREAGLTVQIALAKAIAGEADSVGRHAKALESERLALQKQAELKVVQIENARKAVIAADAQVAATQRLVTAATQQASADATVTDKERVAIASAQADAEAKRGQAAAARAHLDELVRLPESLMNVTSAQALQNGEVRRLYGEADAAVRALSALRAGQQAGQVSAERVAAAETQAAAAVAALGAASVDATAKVGVLTAAQKEAAEQAKVAWAGAAREIEQATAGRAAALDAVAAKAAARAQDAQRDTAAANAQYTEMWDFATAQMLEFGEVGMQAAIDIRRAMGDSFNANFAKMDVWLQQAFKQRDAVAAVTGELQRAAQTGEHLGDALAAANLATDKLSQQQLAPFLAALDAARAKSKSVEESLAQMLLASKQSLAQMKGDAEMAEKLQWQAQKAALDAKLREAEGSGSAQAVADAQQLIAIEREKFKLRMDAIQAEGQRPKPAADAAGAAAGGGAATGTAAHTIVEKVFTLDFFGIPLTGPMSQAGAMDEQIRRLQHLKDSA